MKSKFRICISSPPDRKKIVAEIFYDGYQWAEINQETTELMVEFSNRVDGKKWEFLHNETMEILAHAKSKLI